MASFYLRLKTETEKNAINFISVFALRTVIFFLTSIPSGNIIKPSRRLLHTACAEECANEIRQRFVNSGRQKARTHVKGRVCFSESASADVDYYYFAWPFLSVWFPFTRFSI